MTCREATEWLDQASEAPAPEDVQRHLDGCASCREEQAVQRALLAQVAALPAELDPPRDLWPGIAARTGPRRAGFTLSWTSGLAAAAALAAASSALTAIALRSRPTLESSPAALVQPVASEASDSVRRSEEEYLRAAAALLAALEQQKPGLPAETVSALEHNLQTIDRALGDIRAALAQDPGSTQLAHMLVSTHRKKLDALEQVVKLSAKA